MIDKKRLIEWLSARSGARSPLVAAVYAGLVERIERGEFDVQEDD